MVNIIEQSWNIAEKLDGIAILKKIERVARNCYKSEGSITPDSYKRICKMLIDRKHFAMIEHGGFITVNIISNRGLTHELVRHRLASFAQESTRYCDYTKEKHRKELTVIKPLWIEDSIQDLNNNYASLSSHKWLNAMRYAESAYLTLRKQGRSPQEARGVLPIDIKSEIIITANLREWRHIFQLRTSDKAHPQIRQIMRQILGLFQIEIPIIFDDIKYGGEA